MDDSSSKTRCSSWLYGEGQRPLIWRNANAAITRSPRRKRELNAILRLRAVSLIDTFCGAVHPLGCHLEHA